MTKKENNQFLVVLLLGLALSLPGCTKKEPPPPPQTPQPKPAAKPSPPPVSVQQQASSAKAAQSQFDFSSKKDPFKPYVAEVAQGKPAVGPGKGGKTEEVLPIQSYDVTKFKVAGIIVGMKENSALIIDPKGKGYVVKQGMLIGNNDGRITRIASTYIEVTELYREENGRTRKQTTRLVLSQKK